MTRQEIDAMIYNHVVEFMADGMSRRDAERETARQTGYSVSAVHRAVRRHATK